MPGGGHGHAHGHGHVGRYACTNPVLARTSMDVNDKLANLEVNVLAEGDRIFASLEEQNGTKWLRCASEGPFKGFYFPFHHPALGGAIFKKIIGNVTPEELMKMSSEWSNEHKKFLCTHPVLARASMDVADKLPGNADINTLQEGFVITAYYCKAGKWLCCVDEGTFQERYFPFHHPVLGKAIFKEQKQLELTAGNPGYFNTTEENVHPNRV